LNSPFIIRLASPWPKNSPDLDQNWALWQWPENGPECVHGPAHRIFRKLRNTKRPNIVGIRFDVQLDESRVQLPHYGPWLARTGETPVRGRNVRVGRGMFGRGMFGRGMFRERSLTNGVCLEMDRGFQELASRRGRIGRF
jgi:hypothetical protein